MQSDIFNRISSVCSSCFAGFWRLGLSMGSTEPRNLEARWLTAQGYLEMCCWELDYWWSFYSKRTPIKPGSEEKHDLHSLSCAMARYMCSVLTYSSAVWQLSVSQRRKWQVATPYIHTTFPSAIRHFFPCISDSTGWYLRSDFQFLVGPTVRSYNTNVLTL